MVGQGREADDLVFFLPSIPPIIAFVIFVAALNHAECFARGNIVHDFRDGRPDDLQFGEWPAGCAGILQNAGLSEGGEHSVIPKFLALVDATGEACALHPKHTPCDPNINPSCSLSDGQRISCTHFCSK